MFKSELIEKLTKSIELHGDDTVYVVDGDSACAIEYGKEVKSTYENKVHSEKHQFTIRL